MSDVKECYLCEVGNAFMTSNGKGFHRGDYIPYQEIPIFAQRHNCFGTFASTYRYNKPIPEESDLYGDLYLDLDDDKDFEHVRQDALTALSVLKIVYQITEDQVKIYFSGNKGVHIIVPAELLGVKPLPYLNGVYKLIASKVNTFSKFKTVDLKIYDNKRLFRIPNTRHEKSGLYKIRISPEELRESSESDIRNLASVPRQWDIMVVPSNSTMPVKRFEKDVQEYVEHSKDMNKDKRFVSKITFIPPCVQNILDTGAEEGQRNMTIAALSSFYKLHGESLSEAITIISDWNSKNTVPTGRTELERTVRSIYNSHKTYGCQTFQSLTTCDKKNCRFKQGELHHDRHKDKKTSGQRTSPYKRF